MGQIQCIISSSSYTDIIYPLGIGNTVPIEFIDPMFQSIFCAGQAIRCIVT